jgi:hypothetical protein
MGGGEVEPRAGDGAVSSKSRWAPGGTGSPADRTAIAPDVDEGLSGLKSVMFISASRADWESDTNLDGGGGRRANAAWM